MAQAQQIYARLFTHIDVATAPRWAVFGVFPILQPQPVARVEARWQASRQSSIRLYSTWMQLSQLVKALRCHLFLHQRTQRLSVRESSANLWALFLAGSSNISTSTSDIRTALPHAWAVELERRLRP
jgi:hypothetical protein